MTHWYDHLNRYEPTPKDDTENVPPPMSRHEKNVLEPQDTLDLHGLTWKEACACLDRFVQDARRRGLVKVLVIHGKGLHSPGDGILRKSFREWAARQKGVRVKQAPARHGGSGASLLYLV